MVEYIAKRLILALCVALSVSFISFNLLFLAGDPAIAMAGEGATESDIQAIRELYGFDRPLLVQYGAWLSGALQGDLGESLYFKRPVASLIADHMPVTLKLGAASIVLALMIAVPLGVIASMKPNSMVDRLALLVSVSGQAMPTFWFALMLVVVFVVTLGWLPASGNAGIAYFVLPTVVLALNATPAVMRLTRSGMLEVLDSDYIRTARAKGLPEYIVLLKHALRNAVIPVVSLAAVQFGFMLGGSVVVESIFALNGAGQLAWRSIGNNDFPTVQGLILVFAMIYIVLILLGDLLNAWLDPRVWVA